MAVTAAAIGAGGALLGGGLAGAGGKKGGGGGAEEAAALQARIASELYGQSQPIRGALFGTPGTPAVPASGTDLRRIREIDTLLKYGHTDVPEGNEDIPLTSGEQAALKSERRALQEGSGGIPATPGTPGLLPDFLQTGNLPLALDMPLTSYREGIEDQFQNVEQNIINSVGAKGGQLRDLLADAQISRARSVAEIPLRSLPLREGLFNQALQIASGSPVQAASVAGNAGSLFNALDIQEARQTQQLGQGLGSTAALASMFALGGKQSTPPPQSNFLDTIGGL